MSEEHSHHGEDPLPQVHLVDAEGPVLREDGECPGDGDTEEVTFEEDTPGHDQRERLPGPLHDGLGRPVTG